MINNVAMNPSCPLSWLMIRDIFVNAKCSCFMFFNCWWLISRVFPNLLILFFIKVHWKYIYPNNIHINLIYAHIIYTHNIYIIYILYIIYIICRKNWTSPLASPAAGSPVPPADPHPPAGRSPAAASSSAALAPPRRGPGSAGTSEMGPCYGYGKMGKT